MPISFADREDGVTSAGTSGNLIVGTSAIEAKVGVSTLPNRIYLLLQAKDTGVFFGTDSGVTITSGIELFKDQTLMLPAASSIFLVASSAGRNVRIIELSSDQPE